MAPSWIPVVLVATVFCQFCSCNPVGSGSTGEVQAWPSELCTPAALGMENGDIPDSSITASSIYSAGYEPSTARLNQGVQGWIPKDLKDQWIQVDMGEPTLVTGLTMQGYSTGASHYITAFSVEHSLTSISDDWHDLATDGEAIRFILTTGKPTDVTFPVAPIARFIRIVPLTQTHAASRLRFEVHGCQVPDGYVRLVGGTDSSRGRVEIYHHETGSFGAVCGRGWGLNDAKTVCRQLGLGDAVQAKTASEFGRGDLPILMNRVTCKGTESRLSHCPFACTSYMKCEDSNVAGVVCNSVRLRGGFSARSGRVEIFRDDTWGTVCDHDWDARDARVVCRQLGFTGGAQARSGAHFGQGSGHVHMEGVGCSGSEGDLSECPSICWAASTCGHNRDAGVVCPVNSDPKETNSE